MLLQRLCLSELASSVRSGSPREALTAGSTLALGPACAGHWVGRKHVDHDRHDARRYQLGPSGASTGTNGTVVWSMAMPSSSGHQVEPDFVRVTASAGKHAVASLVVVVAAGCQEPLSDTGTDVEVSAERPVRR